MFFTKKSPSTKMDCFDYISKLTKEVIHFECPEHRIQQHILYTLNRKKQQLLENVNELETMNGNFPSFQQFALQTRNEILTTIAEWNHVEKLYLLTADEQNRHSINHTLTFEAHHIERLYQFFSEQQLIYEQLNRKKEFFTLLKLELLQLTEKLSY